MTGQEIPPLRERLRKVRFTRAAMWSDAELVCILLAEQASAVETAMQRLAGRCHRNAKAAQRPAPSPAGDGRGETPDWTHDGVEGWYVGDLDIELDATSRYGAEVRIGGDRAFNPGQVRRLRQVLDTVVRRLDTPSPAGDAAVGVGVDGEELQRRINDIHRRLAEIRAAHGHRPPARLSDEDQAEADALAAEAPGADGGGS